MVIGHVFAIKKVIDKAQHECEAKSDDIRDPNFLYYFSIHIAANQLLSERLVLKVSQGSYQVNNKKLDVFADFHYILLVTNMLNWILVIKQGYDTLPDMPYGQTNMRI